MHAHRAVMSRLMKAGKWDFGRTAETDSGRHAQQKTNIPRVWRTAKTTKGQQTRKEKQQTIYPDNMCNGHLYICMYLYMYICVCLSMMMQFSRICQWVYVGGASGTVCLWPARTPQKDFDICLHRRAEWTMESVMDYNGWYNRIAYDASNNKYKWEEERNENLNQWW